MKKVAVLGFMTVFSIVACYAQLKSQDERVSAAGSLIRPAPSIGSFLGLLSSDNFMMRHNFSFSYLSSGGDGLSDRKSTRLNSSHLKLSRMPSSA